jgi:ATP-dependent Lon protease
MPLAIGRTFSLEAAKRAEAGDGLFLLLMQSRPQDDVPGILDFRGVGVTARLIRSIPGKNGSVTVLVQALDRARVVEVASVEGRFEATVEVVTPEVPVGDVELDALAVTVRSLVRKLVEVSPSGNAELAAFTDRLEDLSALADVVAAQLDLRREQRQHLIETFDVKDRLREVAGLLGHSLEVLELGQKIEQQVHGQLEEARRQALLREQLKAIRAELGEGEDPDVKRLRQEVAKGLLSPPARQAAERELGRLEGMSAASPERGWIVTYLDWLVALPWTKLAPERADLQEAAAILDREHFGLRKAKERILEALAVRRLNPEGRAPILCFVGPPGTGKTSLAQAIAEATGRELVRISVGGVSDESEIRGHRRTYVGALPGRIIAALRKAGTRNPVFVVDEIDKMAASFHGDPAAALLEVLDPEQNKDFVDRYVEIPFDLSRVLFITTANTLATLPRPLLDRLEVIEVPGYTAHEKVEIARRHLVPRQRRAVGLKEGDVTFGDDVIAAVIDGWTREAGVRRLERALGGILRKLALKAATGEEGPWAVGVDDLPRLLGPRPFFSEAVERMTVPGIAMGLAWTPVGGEILFVEAAATRGSGRLTLTGSLGDVMKESAVAALTWLKGHWEALGTLEADVHVHVPAGAVPKDGPSAGVAMLTALASAITGRMVRPDVAMTGEITLRGQVLPVGGIRDKVLAAARAGVQTVILPRRNEVDLEEVPEEVRKGLAFRFVERVDEVLDLTLEPEAAPGAPSFLQPLAALPGSGDREDRGAAEPTEGEDRRAARPRPG